MTLARGTCSHDPLSTLQDSISGHLYTRAYESHRPQRHMLRESQASLALGHILHIIALRNLMSSCPGVGLSFGLIHHMGLAVRE